MTRQGFLVGFLAGGWLATLLLVLVPHLGMRAAEAEDPPNPNAPPIGPFGPGGGPGVGPTVNPNGGDTTARGIVNPGLGTSDSNNRSIALAASIGGGESVVYYFDTVAERLCVYQYKGGSRGGLRLLSARYIGFDLRLERYRDVSEKSPREMREAYEEAMGLEGDAGGSALPPTRRVELPGGTR